MKLFLQYLKQRWRGIIVGVLFCAIFAVTFDLYHLPVEVENGEYVAIMGESGSGKTTLLNILAALDKPTEGRVILDGQDLSKIKESQIAAFRRDNLGFVFQEFNLLDTFIIEDNIYPQEMAPEDVTAFIDQCYEEAATYNIEHP